MKQKILDAAECFDAWRIVPRIVLFGYSAWLVYAVDRLLNWYMGLPSFEQTTQASSFCGASITALTGIGSYVYRVYSDSGRDWTAQNRTSTVVATTSTVNG